jgi:hypothetical protein
MDDIRQTLGRWKSEGYQGPCPVPPYQLAEFIQGHGDTKRLVPGQASVPVKVVYVQVPVQTQQRPAPQPRAEVEAALLDLLAEVAKEFKGICLRQGRGRCRCPACRVRKAV